MTDEEFCPTLGFRPRPFALCRDFFDEELPDEDSAGDELPAEEAVDDGQVVVGWGMTLPNGSTVVVGCDEGRTTVMSITSSPERAAWLHGADLVWTPPA